MGPRATRRRRPGDQPDPHRGRQPRRASHRGATAAVRAGDPAHHRPGAGIAVQHAGRAHRLHRHRGARPVRRVRCARSGGIVARRRLGAVRGGRRQGGGGDRTQHRRAGGERCDGAPVSRGRGVARRGRRAGGPGAGRPALRGRGRAGTRHAGRAGDRAVDLVVVERSASGPEIAWPDGWTPWRTRRYGDTRIEFAQRD